MDQWIFPVTSWPLFNEASEGVENVLFALESSHTNQKIVFFYKLIYLKIYHVSVVKSLGNTFCIFKKINLNTVAVVV